MDEELKQNLTAAETWLRGLFILLFAFLLVVARIVTGAVVVIQFLFTVFSGRTNENLRYFGASLSQFIFQTLLFVTYNSDTKPFPFSAWPEAEQFDAESKQADDGELDSDGPDAIEPSDTGGSGGSDEQEPRA